MGTDVATRYRKFGSTIFGEMTALAEAHQAINLAQGFPDFEGPEDIIEAAVAALRGSKNQYTRSRGMPLLVNAIAKSRARAFGLHYDPMTEVSVFSGATEALMATAMGLLNPGDEAILFEPFYDSYPACVASANATARYCTLRFPRFEIDPDELRALFSKKTKLVFLNTPHNPTGKVFTRAELEMIRDLVVTHDAYVVADEVYEHLTYEGAKHIPVASIDGLRERTISISSAGKTYSLTGWKIGWATGPSPLLEAVQAAHQFIVFTTSTPLQHGITHALENYQEAYFATLRLEYQERRDHLVETLKQCGFEVAMPNGTYFALAKIPSSFTGNDVDFAKDLVSRAKVAAIPPSSFYEKNKSEGEGLIRFAFCKRKRTLEEARAQMLRVHQRQSSLVSDATSDHDL